MKKLTLWSLLVVLLAAGWWLYTGPQRTLAAIKVAADTNDEVAFRELVDVPAMQADLLAQLLGPPDPNSGPILVTGLSLVEFINSNNTLTNSISYMKSYYEVRIEEYFDNDMGITASLLEGNLKQLVFHDCGPLDKQSFE